MARGTHKVRILFVIVLTAAILPGGSADVSATPLVSTSIAPAVVDENSPDEDSQTEGQLPTEEDADAEREAEAELDRLAPRDSEDPGATVDTQAENDSEDGVQDEHEDPSDEIRLSPRMMSDAPRNTTDSNKGLWGDSRNRRLGGADRYDTAALISKDTYPNPSQVKTVVVATGADFPDALSAAPLAAKLGAPLLMTQPTALTAATKTEIRRLKPDNIVIVGGTGAVSNGVARSLNSLLPAGKTATRIGGRDRYETSVLVAQAGWPSGTQADVFFATGADFPDALSAGAAAGAMGAPVILVPGAGNSVGPQTSSFLKTKRTTTIHVVGGTGVVSAGIANSVKKIGSVNTVKRYAGNDRYGTTAAVANAVFTRATSTYFANAFNFPDALAGAAAAGARGAPLLLTADSCILPTVYDANDRLVPGDTVILGGTGVLKAAVQHGNECMTKPKGASNASYLGMQQLYAKINKARYDAGRTAFRVADTKVGTPAYTWAARRQLTRNTSLAQQQPWVRNEAVARSSAPTKSQVNALFNMFITDTKHGTRNAILRTYGGARGYISVGYFSTSTGYATIHIGTTPKKHTGHS